jgi:hypothetical protein
MYEFKSDIFFNHLLERAVRIDTCRKKQILNPIIMSATIISITTPY